MSSLKMTFSLASLIFLIAFGLVFGTTSVLAHTDLQRVVDNAADLQEHTHPVKVAIPATDKNGDNDVIDEGEGAVPAHTAHPVPELSLKAGQTNVRGTTVAVTSAAGTFTIEIDLGAVSASGSSTLMMPLAIPAGHFTLFMLDKDGVPIDASGNYSIADSAIPSTPTTKNTAVITIASLGLPAVTGDDSHTLRIRMDADVNDTSSRFTLYSKHL